jgi:GT2 family glycosyltransferase
MVFRTNLLHKVGFFDEKIFMYLEDADITRRFLEFSHTVYYPKAIVYHYYSGLTHKKWKYKLITIKSAITYFNKWGWLKSII